MEKVDSLVTNSTSTGVGDADLAIGKLSDLIKLESGLPK